MNAPDVNVSAAAIAAGVRQAAAFGNETRAKDLAMYALRVAGFHGPQSMTAGPLVAAPVPGLWWAKALRAAMENGSPWAEIDAAGYDYALGVLPPIPVEGFRVFMVSEANWHDSQGRAVYSLFAEVGGRYFVRESVRQEAKALTAELRAAVLGGAQ